jgi:hypothetical protein
MSLESLPREPKFDTYAWADYIELLCMLNRDREVSKADVIDRIKERRDLGEGLDADSTLTTTAAEKKDIHQIRADNFFSHLQYRVGAFSNFYPFEISGGGDLLSLKSSLTLDHKLYLFFLVASNLRHVNKRDFRVTLTTSFETVSHEAMKRLFPDYTEIHIFGANELRAGRYTGNKWEKINLLAKDIKEQVKVKEHHYMGNDLGDQGLDLVAWIPFDDTSNGMVLAFAQCACTSEEWSRKQSSSSPAAWNSTLTFMVFPLNLAFIPICFRDSSGDWHQPQKIHESIVIDRTRLIYLLRGRIKFFETDPSYTIIEKILEERESLV